MASFKEKVLKIVRNIPQGQTLSYKEVAILADSPKACRAVGSILHLNYDLGIFCHRVMNQTKILALTIVMKRKRSNFCKMKKLTKSFIFGYNDGKWRVNSGEVETTPV